MAKTVKQPQKKGVPHCPFCDVEIYEMNLPVCQSCHVNIIYCEQCGQPVPKGKKTCPTCGPKAKTSAGKTRKTTKAS
ncbi:MAG: hypothetical protein Q8O43_05455 [Dehalococcoidia bacterium]|nr:hypothetical protein [Dehalococcoidia bacterium]